MPLSRLRLRLAGWFALAFLAGLLVLSLTLLLYMRRQNDQRFSRELAGEAGELLGAIRVEYAEAPEKGVAAATAAALEEWPARPEAFAVYDGAGRQLATTGPDSIARVFAETLPADVVKPVDLSSPSGLDIRVAGATSAAPAFAVLAATTTERLGEDAGTLALWLTVSTPTVVLLSLIAGYVLSRRALRPIGHLERAIAELTPGALDGRLPVDPRPDELDRLAMQFNALLERLGQSQAQNQRFLQQAAHQIRTPLTLVLGETELALDRPRSPEAQADALRRIRLAAVQMQRRVDELLLLARAEAGERAALTDTVELDGLALECAELMRGRAQALGCRLELADVQPVVVTGSEPLLREALVELIENACRHGSKATPVRVSVYAARRDAVIQVVNAIDAARVPPAADTSGRGLGLQVVRWITSEHGGRVVHHRDHEAALYALYLPLGAEHAMEGV